MAIQKIIQEIKTLSSRQVLIIILSGSLYMNFSFIRDNQVENLNYKIIEKEQKAILDKATESRIEDIKSFVKKSYEYERTIDSLKYLNTLRNEKSNNNNIYDTSDVSNVGSNRKSNSN